MVRFDRILCPFCLFTSKYNDLIMNQDGNYVCPECDATFFYEEIMQLYSFTQLLDRQKTEDREPFTL